MAPLFNRREKGPAFFLVLFEDLKYAALHDGLLSGSSKAALLLVGGIAGHCLSCLISYKSYPMRKRTLPVVDLAP